MEFGFLWPPWLSGCPCRSDWSSGREALLPSESWRREFSTVRREFSESSAVRTKQAESGQIETILENGAFSEAVRQIE